MMINISFRHIPFFYKPCIPLLCSKRLFLIVLPDFHTAYFTADGFGKFVYKLYDARILVRCGHFLYVVLQLLDQFLAGIRALSTSNGPMR